MNRFVLFFAGVCLLPTAAWGQLTPEVALKKFTVADGLQIELFAAEPMLINPTSIDVDEKGRVWVAEAVNYRRVGFKRPILREEGDRIVILEDTNADGKADKSHVFYQGKDLYGPLGVCVAPYPNPDKKGAISYRVFVCQSPDILVFEDKDGDLKADGPPKKFLTGFSGFDHDHGVHGINIGPDGKLYFTVGDAGVKDLQSSDGKGRKFTSNQTDCRAGTVWRCDMDGKSLELIAHNFRNNYECCVNSFGEVWLSDNDDDGNQQTRICFVMPGGNYGYHPRGPGQHHWHEDQPGIVHKAMRTGFGSPTGICFYEGSLLPKKYQGQLLHTDAGPRELRCFTLKPKGAGYELDKDNIVTSTDNWFRPSDVCVAPDGSVMIADWYDPGVGGHGMGDWTRGRIYRVTPKGHAGYKVPEVKLDTFEGLIAAFPTPCLATRLRILAITKTLDNSKKQYLGEFCENKPQVAPMLGARAWMVAMATGDSEDQRFIPGCMIKSFEPEMIKVAGIRLADSMSARTQTDPKKPFFRHRRIEEILEKPSNFFAREILLACRNEPIDVANRYITELIKLYDGQDRSFLAALNIACGTDPARRDAILADFDKHFPEWNDKVADLVWELRPKSVIPRLPKLLEDTKLTGVQKARIIDILAASDDVSAGQTMLELLKSNAAPEVKARAISLIQQYLPGKWKSLQGSKDLNAAIEELLAKPATRANGLQLIAAAGLTASVAPVKEIAKSDPEIAIRKEAIDALGKLKSEAALDALMEIGTPENPLTIACVQAIGLHLPSGPKPSAWGPKALDALQRAINAPKASTELKRTALSTLAGNQAGTQWLLDVAEKKQLPTELTADAGKLLRNTPFQAQRNKALQLFPAPGKLDPKKLPAPSELAKRQGNVERGKQLMLASLKADTQCMRCHVVNGVGGAIGPDLSKIGAKASRENLYESMLQPSKAIADQFLQWQIENTAGQKIIGLNIEETPEAVTIRDANGKDTKIAKADIESRTKSPISIMPEDLVKTLTEDDLIDVVEYLFTLK